MLPAPAFPSNPDLCNTRLFVTARVQAQATKAAVMRGLGMRATATAAAVGGWAGAITAAAVAAVGTANAGWSPRARISSPLRCQISLRAAVGAARIPVVVLRLRHRQGPGALLKWS